MTIKKARKKIHCADLRKRIELGKRKATGEKLARNNDREIIIDNTRGYRIIEFFSVFTAISNIVLAGTKFCKMNI